MTKYRAIPTVVDNITFASKKEAKRYSELKLLFRAGEIKNLEIQPEFPFEINGKTIFIYRADFAYYDGADHIIEDVKGFKTPVYRLKKKLIEARYGIKITET